MVEANDEEQGRRGLPEWWICFAVAVACLLGALALKPIALALSPRLAVGMAGGFGWDGAWQEFQLDAHKTLYDRYREAFDRREGYQGDSVSSSPTLVDPWGSPWVVRSLPSAVQESPDGRVRVGNIVFLEGGKPYSSGPNRQDEQGAGDDVLWSDVKSDGLTATLGTYLPTEVLRAPRAWLLCLAVAFGVHAFVVRAWCSPRRGPLKAEIGRATLLAGPPSLLAVAWGVDIVGQRWVTEAESALGEVAPVTGLPVAVAGSVVVCLFALALALRLGRPLPESE